MSVEYIFCFDDGFVFPCLHVCKVWHMYSNYSNGTAKSSKHLKCHHCRCGVPWQHPCLCSLPFAHDRCWWPSCHSVIILASMGWRNVCKPNYRHVPRNIYMQTSAAIVYMHLSICLQNVQRAVNCQLTLFVHAFLFLWVSPVSSTLTHLTIANWFWAKHGQALQRFWEGTTLMHQMRGVLGPLSMAKFVHGSRTW